ncbi:low temperature requirement protein LtrA [Kribbella voronezhensis]|uniref:Low temperature requirement protein LtrA n=1 Tax=Kribbella voronezhensis TaxID=2512212 RepID=A0A4R7SSE3_9ACTN|nr:low temperature requirement protein A [Kribbella voronezhensis]TDU82170.1 low temperature requirement protein LtrA [Kribbella voronezhensis]
MTEDVKVAEERHASWLELFFDLIVVAAAAQISHRLHGAETVGQVAACAAMFYAIWSVWTSTSVYANVAGERTRQLSVLLTMLGVGVMTASVPGVWPGLLPEGDHHPGNRTVAFTVAFLYCRAIAARSAGRDGQVITFWPGTQSLMATPWIVALFVPEETAHWLWAGAIAADLMFSLMGSRNPKALERTEQAMLRQQEDRRRKDRFARLLSLGRVTPAEAPQPTLLSVAKVERGHLDERLGLFVIIVLGEAVAQVVAADADLVWTVPVVLASVLAFALLVGLWRLTTLYGFSTAPRTTAPLEPSIALSAHLGVTAAMIAIAAGLGGLIMAAGEHLATMERGYLFGGLALYFVVSVLTGIAGRAPLKWFLGWALPSLLASVAVAVLGHPLPAWSLAVLAGVILLWFSTYNWLSELKESRARAT